MMRTIKKMPLAVSSIALALAALGNLLLPHGEWVRNVCGALAAAVFVLFVLKLALDFRRVREELKNPVALSILPTATMAAMLLCAYAKPYIGPSAVTLWYAAAATQILIMLFFATRFFVGFDLKNVFPSWFVTGVGIVAASVTSPAMGDGAKSFGQAVFYAGFVLYLILLPLVIYRMGKLKPLPEPTRPTIAIFTAPTSLCVVGYLSAFEQPNAALVYFMLAVSTVSYVYVTLSMVSLLRLKFYPTYAAFTFPYVISAIAFKAGNAFLVKNGYEFFSLAPGLSEWVAVAVIVYVLVRYAVFVMDNKGEQR